jgi:hypothetical protein
MITTMALALRPGLRHRRHAGPGPAAAAVSWICRCHWPGGTVTAASASHCQCQCSASVHTIVTPVPVRPGLRVSSQLARLRLRPENAPTRRSPHCHGHSDGNVEWQHDDAVHNARVHRLSWPSGAFARTRVMGL